jgi:hypothetical protein
MKTKKPLPTEEVSQRIERYSRSHIILFVVLFCLLFALTKMDSALLKTMRTSYAYGMGLIDEYAREEPIRTPPNIGSETRLITMSGA